MGRNIVATNHNLSKAALAAADSRKELVAAARR
jgi:hypothetical protein